MTCIETIPCHERSPWDHPVDLGDAETFEVEIHEPPQSVLVPVCLYLPSFWPPETTTYQSSKYERAAIDNLRVKANALVVVVHFRQTSWDAALSDVKAAFAWILKSAPRFRADRHKIFIAATGLSCSLAAGLCLFDSSDDPSRYPGAPNKPGRLKGMMLHGPLLRTAESGCQDGDPSAAQAAKACKFLGIVDALSPLVSPLCATSSDLRRLPPAAVYASKGDPSVEDATRWAKLLNSNKVKASVTLYDAGDTALMLSSPAFLETDQEEGAIFVLWESVFHPLLE